MRGELVACSVAGCGNEYTQTTERLIRVCPEHRTAHSFVLKGEKYRFCRQCSRPHPLSRFQGGSTLASSCDARLEKRRDCRRQSRSRASEEDKAGSSRQTGRPSLTEENGEYEAGSAAAARLAGGYSSVREKKRAQSDLMGAGGHAKALRRRQAGASHDVITADQRFRASSTGVPGLPAISDGKGMFLAPSLPPPAASRPLVLAERLDEMQEEARAQPISVSASLWNAYWSRLAEAHGAGEETVRWLQSWPLPGRMKLYMHQGVGSANRHDSVA